MKRASVTRRNNSSPPVSPSSRSRSAERANGCDSPAATNDDFFHNTTSAIDDMSNIEDDPDIRRSMSDPFDSQFLDALSSLDVDDDEDTTAATPPVPSTTATPNINNANTSSYPTLPRYPVASTRDTNCWSESPLDLFRVRGPDYFHNHEKVASHPFLLSACGADLFLLRDESNNATQHHTLDPSALLQGQFTKRPTLGIVFAFTWGYMNMYFSIPDLYTQQNVDVATLSPAQRAFYRWYNHDDDDDDDNEYRNDRLKLIAYVHKGPWIVRNLVNTGRPAIMGRKLPVSYNSIPTTTNNSNNNKKSLLVTLSIGQGARPAAQRIVSVCRRYMAALTVDVGWVIESKDETELPEVMLGAVRLHHPDPLQAPRV